MQSTDQYTKMLTDIIVSLENCYHLNDNNLIANNDIVSVISAVNNDVLETSPKDKAAMNSEAGKQIVLLAYLFFRLDYFRGIRFDYSVFPAMDKVAEILDDFKERKNFMKCIRKLNQIIEVLATVDKKSVKARCGLGYRYLRIFIVLVMYKNSCNASIVARCILRQILMKAGRK